MDRDSVVPKIKKIPGPNALKWVQHHFKFGSKSTYEREFVWDRSRQAIGPFATDVDGNVVLDFAMHVATLALGYNNPEVLNLIKKFPAVDPDRYAGTDFIAGYGPDPDESPFPTPTHMQEKLVKICSHLGFSKSFLISTGTEANENAVKMCYDYRKNRGYSINFDGSFHGRTLGSLTLTHSKAIHKKWFPNIPNNVSLPYCTCKDECHCGWMIQTKKGRMHRLANLIDKDVGTIVPEEIAFVIMEPVQGEGGYNFPNPEFVKEVGEICKEHDIPIISDEIQAGVGRTGKWWGIEHYDIEPSLITSAKALRVGAVIGKEKIFPQEESRVSGTWSSGNALSTAVGYKTLEIIEKQNLLENARKMGTYCLGRLEELEEDTSLLNPRGKGLMMAFDLPDKKKREETRLKMLDKGLMLLACGYNSIRILPPLDVTEREIDLAVDIISDCV